MANTHNIDKYFPAVPSGWLNTLCLIAGLAQALSMAWPFQGFLQGAPQGWLQCLSLTVFAALLDRSQTAKQAFTRSWLYAFAWLSASIWWLFISLHTYGGLAAPLAVAAVALLAGGLALYYSIACAAFHRLCQHHVGVLSKAFAFAALWMLAEMARGTLWTGFPWAAVGYAHVDSPLRHWAPWVGVYGLCALSAWIAMAVGAQRRGLTSRHPRIDWIVVVSVVAVLGYTWAASPSRASNHAAFTSQPLRVTLLQGNIPQELKFGESVSRALHDYRDALLSSTSDLTVTPETAIPMTPEQMPERYWTHLQAHYANSAQAALLGVPLAARTEQGQLQYSNSVVGFIPQATPNITAPYQYDKHHLVPFGEFVPPMFHWFVRMLDIPLGDFTPGDLVQPLMRFKGERIAPNICFEDLFGEEIARNFADPENAPTLMVNLSNIAWFGDTVAIDQHLHVSRMRALEMGRPMLRATNTGATAIIDAQGQVSHRLPSFVTGALTADVFGAHGPITPYARWASHWGLMPLGVLAIFTLLIVGTLRCWRARP